MKKVDRYMSNDGREFDNETACKKHEKMVAELDALFGKLPPLPKNDECKFANGGGFIQHGSELTLVVKEFYRLACNYHKGLNAYSYNTYGFWRTLDDSGSIFYHYGQRLLNTDETTLREYGQGYYKNNPDKCNGGQINPVRSITKPKGKLSADDKEVVNLLG